MNAPDFFRAGDSVTWTETLDEYSAAAGWALKFRLLWLTGSAVSFTGAGAGNIFTVALTPTDTAGWVAGIATLVAWVEKTGGRAVLLQKQVTILPDLTIAATFDDRSAAVKGLSDARACMAAYVAKGQGHVLEYDVAGRRMKFKDTAQIADLIHYYEREVAKENAARAVLEGGRPGRVNVRF